VDAETLAREALSNAGWALALALVATAAGLFLGRRPALIHTLWLLVLLKLATPSLVHRPWEADAEHAEVAPIATMPRVEVPKAVALPEPTARTEVGTPEMPMVEARPAPIVERTWPWRGIAIGVWLGGAAAWWSAVAWQVVRSRNLLRGARPAPLALRDRSERLARRIGLRRAPAVGLVDARMPPLLWAIAGPPRLLLPEGLWARLDEGQQDAVLVHELAHLRRRDHWVRWLEAGVLGLYWWNPVAWWARRRVEAAEEECCDAWVRWALPGSVDAYAEALVEAAVFLSGPRPPWSPGTTGIRAIPPLRRRLMMILSDPATGRKSRPGPRAALLLGILALPFLPAPSPAEPARQVPEAQAPPAQPAQAPRPDAPPATPDKPPAEKTPAPKADDATDKPWLRVAHPIVREVNDYEEFKGHVEAAQTVEIRSRVGGILDKVQYRDGQVVEKGDVLFEIDPETAKAEFDKADAEASRSEARLVRCTADKRRADAMLARNSIGREDFDRIEGDFAEAAASFRGAKASRDLAKIKLDSTKIRAAIGGRLSRPRLSEGNLVAAETTVLGIIDSQEPMYVTFDIEQYWVLKLSRSKRNEQAKASPGVGLAVRVGLQAEADFPRSGWVESTASQIDRATGTLRCRAVIPNSDGLLIPGLFARARLIFEPPVKALLVPEDAAINTQGEWSIWVANEQDFIESRPIRVGKVHDGMRAVTWGLNEKDWVFFTKHRYGAGRKVEPVRVEMPIGVKKDS